MSKNLPLSEIPSLRYEIGELFTPSAPVNVAELFAGRLKQIQRLTDAVAERGRHVIIYGERGVGKTSLSQIVEYLVPSRNRTLRFFRKPCDPSDNFTSLWKKLFQDIRFEVRSQNDTEIYSVDDLYTSNITPYDVVREMKYFGKNDVPIFVIDEFNELNDKDAPTLMANTIKALSDEGLNTTIVIVGVADNVNQLFSSHESINRCSEEIHMPRMSNEELSEIIDKRLKQLGMTIDTDARWKIIVLSRGLPMYVHSLGKFSALKAVSNRRTEIYERDVDEAIEDMLTSSQQSLRKKFEIATRSNQPGNTFKEVLLACALTRSDDNGFFTPASVREPLSKILGKSTEITQYQSHLNSFITDKRGFILEREGSDRAYRFRFKDPAMQPYILMKGIVDKQLDQNLGIILSFPREPDLFPKNQ